jgi:hypothetical protein
LANAGRKVPLLKRGSLIGTSGHPALPHPVTRSKVVAATPTHPAIQFFRIRPAGQQGPGLRLVSHGTPRVWNFFRFCRTYSGPQPSGLRSIFAGVGVEFFGRFGGRGLADLLSLAMGNSAKSPYRDEHTTTTRLYTVTYRKRSAKGLPLNLPLFLVFARPYKEMWQPCRTRVYHIYDFPSPEQRAKIKLTTGRSCLIISEWAEDTPKGRTPVPRTQVQSSPRATPDR